MNTKGKLSSTMLENIDYSNPNSNSSKIIENALKDTEVMSDAPPQMEYNEKIIQQNRLNTNNVEQPSQFQYNNNKSTQPIPPPNTPIFQGNNENDQINYNLHNPVPPFQNKSNEFYQKHMDNEREDYTKKINFLQDIKNPLFVKRLVLLFLIVCIVLHNTVQEKFKKLTPNEVIRTVISSAAICVSYFIVTKIFLKSF